MIVDFFGNEIRLNDIVVRSNHNLGYGHSGPAFQYFRVIRVNPKMIRIQSLKRSKKPYEDTVYGETVIKSDEGTYLMHILKNQKERA